MSDYTGEQGSVGILNVGEGDETWELSKGFLPILTSWSKDEDYLNRGFPMHTHVDWRFVPEEAAKRILTDSWAPSPLLFVMTAPEKKYLPYFQPMMQQMKMMRRMPPLPHFEQAHWMPQLERDFACAALMNGKCPHRGTPVSAMVKRNGVLVCPAHGLRWDCKTGLKQTP